MNSFPVDLLMFVALFFCVLSGIPIAFVLSGVAVAFAAIGWAAGIMEPHLLGALVTRIFDLMTNETLVAIPLFVFMGMMLQRAKIAEELLETMGALFGSVRGGLGVSVTLVGALLAASTGIVGATTVVMGLMALPAMLRHGYSSAFGSGSICAAGTLGQIIPPSTVLIIMGTVLSSAYQQAQQQLGNFAAESISVGQLFAGSIFPGLLLVALYIVYQLAVAFLRPDLAPPVLQGENSATPSQPISARQVINALFPPLALMTGVLGSILGGVATATEAASVGALGATLLAAMRVSDRRWSVWLAIATAAGLMLLASQFDLRFGLANTTAINQAALVIAVTLLAFFVSAIIVIWRDLRISGIFGDAVGSTTKITSMIFTIAIGALLFSLVFHTLGGAETIKNILEAAPGGTYGSLFVVLVTMFFLGLFLDYVEISIIVIPVVGPPLMAAGVDPLWFGVLVALVMQTSFLTPPVGYTLAYLRSVAPQEVSTGAIWQGAIPFVLLQLLSIGIVVTWPVLVTWLPGVLF